MSSEQNIIMAPADIYVGTYGSVTEPTTGNFTVAPTAGGWTSLGWSEGPVVLKVDEDTKQLEVDQLMIPVGSRTVKRTVSLSLTVAETTFENLIYALNGGTIATGSGFKSFTPPTTAANGITVYKSVLLRGKGVAGLDRVVIIRKAYNNNTVEMSNGKGDQQGWKLELMGHYVDASTAPWISHEATA